MGVALSNIDIVVFIAFVVVVLIVGLLGSRGEKQTSEDYFLAGRKLTWPLIGFSLIAANISAEQMVGMSGAAANAEIGLAIASWEWIAAITLVGVGFLFLPTFLRTGIYTIPQFLEQRFTPGARTLLSLLTVFVLCLVNIATVTYLGAKFFVPYYEGTIGLSGWCWIVAAIAAVYVAVGGLKATAWADVIQGAALIIGGAVITVLAMMALDDPDPTKYSGINSPEIIQQQLGPAASGDLSGKLGVLKEERMHLFLPATSVVLPWTAFLLGVWIPNFYYWGLNQYIVQRTLGSRSLAEGQKGIVFAAMLKLIIPFVVVVPGIIGFTLYSGKMAEKADRDTNIKVVEAFTKAEAELAAGTPPAGPAGAELFLFDDEYASRDMALARRIFTYNATLASATADEFIAKATTGPDGQPLKDPVDGKPKTEAEALADANDALTSAAKSASAKVFTTSARLDGYDFDDAFPILVRWLTPSGIRGFIIAAVMGAVVSSLASMYNAASTIFTMDVYRALINKNASQSNLVWVGRAFVPIAAVVGCIIAPNLGKLGSGAFNFIQEFQGYIFPILAVFIYGLFVKRAPRQCGIVGVALSPVVYGILHAVTLNTDFAPNSLGALVIDPFINRIAITFFVIMLVLGLMTAAKPMPEPFRFEATTNLELKGSGLAKVGAVIVIAVTVLLYIVFA